MLVVYDAKYSGPSDDLTIKNGPSPLAVPEFEVASSPESVISVTVPSEKILLVRDFFC